MTLYNLRFKGLLSKDLVKATRAGRGTPELRRRAIADNGDIFLCSYCGRASYYLFYGVLYSGSRMAGRYLLSGCSKPVYSPRLSIGTENGKHRKLEGARHVSNSINPFKRNHSNRTQPLFAIRNVRTDRTGSMLREVSYVY